MKSRHEKTILEQFNTHHLLDLMGLCSLLPTIDKSTIYRNLKRMVDRGVLKELHIKEGITSYELSTHDHQHLLCKSCDSIEKIEIDNEELLKLVSKDVKVESLELNVSGLCNTCRQSRQFL